MTIIKFLPGVPEKHILARIAKAGGHELESGKLANPESSAALALNCFGWFIERPELLPPFPGLDAGFPPVQVEVEYEARFPWSGGMHPWLDAVVITSSHLVGVESKRFEPFRDRKLVSFSEAYDRPVWGDAMGPYQHVRDALKSGAQRFEFLDAAQLVKHAFGLVTDGQRKAKQSVLVYLFAEPAMLNGRPIPDSSIKGHRDEVNLFAKLVYGAGVRFLAVSYRDWIATWARCDPSVVGHGVSVIDTFAL